MKALTFTNQKTWPMLKFFADKQMNRQTNGQAKNSMLPIYRCRSTIKIMQILHSYPGVFCRYRNPILVNGKLAIDLPWYLSFSKVTLYPASHFFTHLGVGPSPLQGSSFPTT